MMQGRGLRRRRPLMISLSLHRVRSSVPVYSSHSSAPYTCPRLVRGMIEQSSNVVNEERVQLLGDLFFVGKLQCSLKRNPSTRQFCQLREDDGSYQTPLRCIGPILTTCRVFSLLRMPSLRPRVMPATFSNFVPLIMWLSGKCVSIGAELVCCNSYLRGVPRKRS
jgi:hypothetical protein